MNRSRKDYRAGLYICNILYNGKNENEQPNYGFFFVDASCLEDAKKKALEMILNPSKIEQFTDYYEAFIKPSIMVMLYNLESPQKYVVRERFINA